MSSEVAYLQSLRSVRERCSKVFSLAEQDKLEYWDVDLSKESDIVEFTCGLIERDFGSDYDSIPPHGRWGHFRAGGTDRVQALVEAWRNEVAPVEIARRLLDLFVVSVLLDAGAGPHWSYKPAGAEIGIGRSEGLAIASLDMVKSGMFSSGTGPDESFRVDALGLSKSTVESISAAMQVSESNPMVGIQGRAQLLIQLGKVLSDSKNAKYFASSEEGGPPRPGNMLDYLRHHPSAQMIPSPSRLPIALPLDTLWEVIVQGLGGVWPPSRTKLDGVALGDVWQCDALKATAERDSDALVAFHKLSQWLTYSLMEIFDKILGWQFTGTEYATGLPEYRNGGLLIDFGLLTIRPKVVLESLGKGSDGTDTDPLDLPPLPASHSAIVEFRAVTVIMLDRIAAGINKKLGTQLALAQVLEAATWKGVRRGYGKRRIRVKATVRG